jgi:hypothetical protein
VRKETGWVGSTPKTKQERDTITFLFAEKASRESLILAASNLEHPLVDTYSRLAHHAVISGIVGEGSALSNSNK